MNHPNPIVMQVQKAKMTQAANAAAAGAYQNGPYQTPRVAPSQSPGVSTHTAKTETPERNAQSPSDRSTQPMTGISRIRSDDSYRTPDTGHSDVSRSSTFPNSQSTPKGRVWIASEGLLLSFLIRKGIIRIQPLFQRTTFPGHCLKINLHSRLLVSSLIKTFLLSRRSHLQALLP
jgi:hypothetical protein